MWRKPVWAFFAIAALFFFTDRITSAEQRAEIQLGKGVISPDAEKNYFTFISYRPQEIQKDWRFHYGAFGGKDGKVFNIVGVDWYKNSEALCSVGAVVFSQVGVGLSFFDKRTPNLGSQLELHLFSKWGVREGNKYVAFGLDHFSNGGVTEENHGENFSSIAVGFYW